MRKIRKPRTKEQPWYYQGECMYFDGISCDGKPIHECFEPWNSQCMDGDIHKCLKLRLKWLASLSPKKRESELEKYEEFHKR